MKTTHEVNAHTFDGRRFKIFRSPGYNYNFDKKTGRFARWGTSLEDDPRMAPAPEILDIEIATGNCSGKLQWEIAVGNAHSVTRTIR